MKKELVRILGKEIPHISQGDLQETPEEILLQLLSNHIQAKYTNGLDEENKIDFLVAATLKLSLEAREGGIK